MRRLIIATGFVGVVGVGAPAQTERLFLDDFNYVVSRTDPATLEQFIGHGWRVVKSEQNGRGDGLLYTGTPEEFGAPASPAGGRVLAVQSLGGTNKAQTDFYLEYGSTPGDVWFQFWIYPQPAPRSNRNKFIYATNDSYPSHSHKWMLGDTVNSYNPFHRDASNGFFITLHAAEGVSTIRYTGRGSDPESLDQLGPNLKIDQAVVVYNRWTLVRMHMRTTSATGGLWEMWLQPQGGQMVKVADYVGGVTPGLVWNVSEPGGHSAFRMPTTVGGASNGWHDYLNLMDDFAIAGSAAGLPTY
jgi:hypothetical protein